MTARRDFLKTLATTAAGILVPCSFTDCSNAATLNLQQSVTPRPKRRQAIIGGRPVRTIDLHCHLEHLPDIWKVIPKDQVVPPYLEAEAKAFRGGPIPVFVPRSIADKRLSDMDDMGIDIQAVSINANSYWAPEDLARQIVQIQNEKIAELCATVPDRFVGLATVSLPYPELAAEQLETSVKKLGMRGVNIGGSVNGEELSSAKFSPFWAKAEQLGSLVFIHPWGFNGLQDSPDNPQPRLGGNGWLTNVIGNPLETTIALSHLIQEGTLDRFPRLKILAAHAGGFLPSYAGRTDECLRVVPKWCEPVDKKPSEYLKQLYYDSMTFTSEGLRHLIAEVGIRQIVLGTDYPTPWNPDGVDRILAQPGLDDADRIALLGGTAAKLLGLSAE